MTTARLLIRLDAAPRRQNGDAVGPAYESLSWWNTHYRVLHRWMARRVETRLVPGLRGYQHREDVRLPCPHCRQPLHYRTADVNRVRGEIRCGFCKGQFAMHPGGQVFVAILDAARGQSKATDPRGEEAARVRRAVEGQNWGPLDCHVMPYRKGSDVLEVEADYADRSGASEVRRMAATLRASGLDVEVEAYDVRGSGKRRAGRA